METAVRDAIEDSAGTAPGNSAGNVPENAGGDAVGIAGGNPGPDLNPDLNLFDRLIRNLLHTDVHRTDGKEDVFSVFEKKYCYNRYLQPDFTKDNLGLLADKLQKEIIYGLQDELGVCLLLFLFAGNLYLVGPYVRKEFEEEKIQRLLIRKNVPLSFLSSLRLYYNSFPMIGTSSIRAALSAFIRSFSGTNQEYAYCRLKNTSFGSVLVPEALREEVMDYSSLYIRYDLENRFLRLVELGDTENVLTAFQDMGIFGMEKYRYINAIYLNPDIGNGMLRAMVRKAAERGGASLIEIHEITQRAVQQTALAKNDTEKGKITARMVYELTEAVLRSRTDLGSYSGPIRKVISYIRLNSSQKITLPDLCSQAGLSESYLSKTFKQEVGVSIFQYIAQLRCSQAAELLKNSKLPIQEISSYVGYEDNNYFVKVFKKQYHVTPGEYRAAGNR